MKRIALNKNTAYETVNMRDRHYETVTVATGDYETINTSAYGNVNIRSTS